MSIYSTPIFQLTPADLAELLADEAVENIRLEFKSELPTKAELAKKLSSFANTYGGLLVVGAAAKSSDGKLTGLPGVEEIPGLKQKIVQWCFDEISPPLQVEISGPIPSPADSSRFCYVIKVPESEIAPHFINGRRGVYIRTDEYSQLFEPQLATLDEILRLTERRKPILERRARLRSRARSRFESFAEAAYEELGKSKSLGAHFLLFVSPRYPAELLFEPQALLQRIKSLTIPWRQVGFPRLTRGVISQHESALVLRPGSSFSLLEATVWGHLTYASEMEFEVKAGGPSGIHLNHFLGQVLVFLEHAKQLLLRSGFLGELEFGLELRCIKRVKWVSFPDGFPEEGPASLLDSATSFDLQIPSNRLFENRDEVAADLLREIFFALNWAEVAATEWQLQQLLVSAYKYNFWQPPAE